MRITLYPPQAIYELGQRQNQEDAIFPKIGKATDKDRLFILCDGMGGYEKGEVASNTISQALATYLDKNASADAVINDEMLLDALEYAYQQLDAKDDGAAKKMGTTLCMLLIHSGGVTAMHIGDSRIYHIRPSEHRIIYQSKDHSLVYDLYQAGEISYDEMRTSSQKNIITRAIQPGEDNRVRPSIVHITDIQNGDNFYICSDGMLEQMSNEELCDMVSAKGSDEKKRQQLIAATADNKDNHSAYLIHINNVVIEPNDDKLLDDEQTSPDNAVNLKPRVVEEDEVSIVSTEQQDVTQVNKSPKANVNGIKKHRIFIAAVGIFALVVVVIAAVFIKPPINKDSTEQSNADKLVVDSSQTDTKISPIIRYDSQPNVKVIVKDVSPRQNTVGDTVKKGRGAMVKDGEKGHQPQVGKTSSPMDGQTPNSSLNNNSEQIKKIKQVEARKRRKATEGQENVDESDDKV